MLNLLMSKPFYAELGEGKNKVTLTGWKYTPHKTDPTNDYIEMTFNRSEGNIPYKRNMFERDISIAVSHIRRQLNMQNETLPDIGGFFDKLISDKIELDMWVTYPVVPTKNGPQKRQNIYFLEPIETAETESSVGSAADEIPPTMN